MYLTQITFGRSNIKKWNKEELSDLAATYLSSLLKNGQIYGDYNYAWFKGRLRAFVHSARPNSLELKYHSKRGKEALKTIIEHFGQEPVIVLIDDDVPKSFKSWKSATSLFLFTHAFKYQSSICNGDSGESIPLYLLALEDKLAESICNWSRSYKTLDNLWLDSGSLEKEAYREMVDPFSKLSSDGREICEEIEKNSGIPCYYYLQRYWVYRDSEMDRKCPSCNKKWCTELIGKEKPFHHFDFKCNRCRLVSHLGSSVEGDRLAKIGELKK